MKIDVRQEFIDAGMPCHYAKCPIALAFLGDHAVEVAVLPDHVFRWQKDRKLRQPVTLPAEAQEFISAFDVNGAKGVKPFSFEIDLP